MYLICLHYIRQLVVVLYFLTSFAHARNHTGNGISTSTTSSSSSTAGSPSLGKIALYCGGLLIVISVLGLLIYIVYSFSCSKEVEARSQEEGKKKGSAKTGHARSPTARGPKKPSSAAMAVSSSLFTLPRDQLMQSQIWKDFHANSPDPSDEPVIIKKAVASHSSSTSTKDKRGAPLKSRCDADFSGEGHTIQSNYTSITQLKSKLNNKNSKAGGHRSDQSMEEEELAVRYM